MDQDRGSSAGNELLLMGEQTVVTASKKAQRVRVVPAAITVITEEEIRASTDVYETFGFDNTHSHNSFVSLSYTENRARNSITAPAVCDFAAGPYQEPFIASLLKKVNPFYNSRRLLKMRRIFSNSGKL